MSLDEEVIDEVAVKEQEEREKWAAIRKLNHPDFPKYFRYTDTSEPEKGDIIAKFGAIAEIVGGADKDHLINVCLQPDSAKAAAQVMRKVFNAAEWDVWGVPRQITEDLVNGMSVDDIKEKIYSYALELFFYTKPMYMPKPDENDHRYWSLIRIVNLEDYLKISVSHTEEPDDRQNEEGIQEGEVDTDNRADEGQMDAIVEIPE